MSSTEHDPLTEMLPHVKQVNFLSNDNRKQSPLLTTTEQRSFSCAGVEPTNIVKSEDLACHPVPAVIFWGSLPFLFSLFLLHEQFYITIMDSRFLAYALISTDNTYIIYNCHVQYCLGIGLNLLSNHDKDKTSDDRFQDSDHVPMTLIRKETKARPTYPNT